MIVIDCSAIVSFLLRPNDDESLASAIFEADALAAPELIDIECLSALRRLEASGRIPSHIAEACLSAFEDLRIERFASLELRRKIWALRHNFSAYDAAYVSLARTLRIPLLTRDMRLRRAVAEHTSIDVI